MRRSPTKYPKEVREWLMQQTECAVCFAPLATAWPPAAPHHIIRQGRKNFIWNLMPLCGGCHEDHHGTKRPGMPGLELAHILFVKLLSDSWEPDLLEELYGKRLPWPKPLPEEYLELRRHHRSQGRPVPVSRYEGLNYA